MSKETKPGWRSSEFWLSAASCLVGALLGSGVLGEGSELEKIGGYILMGLATAGYGLGRSFLKNKSLGSGK